MGRGSWRLSLHPCGFLQRKLNLHQNHRGSGLRRTRDHRPIRRKTMNTQLIPQLVLALVLVAGGSSAYAQSGGAYDLSWNTLDSAGGTCVNGSFNLSGTVGQPDAATARGGSFTLAGGFWQGMNEVGPMLNIVASSGSVIISWPATATGFHLEHCTDLSQRNWVNNTTLAFVFGTDKVVVEPASGVRFYRLTKQ